MSDIPARILAALNAEIIKRGGDPNSLADVKTEAYYARTLDQDVRNLYGGKLTEREFVDRQVSRIDSQFDRAWNDGMRQNGLDPKRDMTDAFRQALDDRKLKELDYIEDYAAEIAKAGKDGQSVEPFRQRVNMWANRYNEVVDLSKTTTRPDDRFKWVYGPTEHCEDCQKLNGIVATGKDWQASGWAPQSHDLACHGYNCQCRLELTDDKATPGGIPAKQ